MKEDILQLTLNAMQGICLEEALLYLLGTSGYQPVTDPSSDPTLHYDKSKGTCVIGRGERHQIDALADFFVTPPFSYPLRLLVESKFHQKSGEHTGIEIIRNAVGVLKDVSEYWVIPRSAKTSSYLNQNMQLVPRSRYHYQYAIISSTSFTQAAENYAFAQDIMLIQVAHSRYFQPVLQAIRDLKAATNTSDLPKISQTVFRAALRKRLGSPLHPEMQDIDLTNLAFTEHQQLILETFCQACSAIKVGIMATSPEGMPILLVANPQNQGFLRELSVMSDAEIKERGRIRRDADSGGWIVTLAGEEVFSFDLPPHFFALAMANINGLDIQTTTFQVLLADITNRLQRSSPAVRVLNLRFSSREVRQFLAELQSARGII